MKKITFPTYIKPLEAHALSEFGSDKIGVTNRYLTRDGKPYIYVMGELHYSRVKACDWRRELRKMKEGGIEIVSSYVIWIHHEESRGVFDFDGNRDIRAFVDACEEEGMPFFLRIGPWAHGEARNGGFPDWLEKECDGRLRDNVEPFMSYVRRFFERLYAELRTSENIIGIQIENELYNRPDYLLSLKRLVKEIGFRAPLISATAWGSAKLPRDEFLPMFGTYPEAPWTNHTRPLEPGNTWMFSDIHDDALVGNDSRERADSLEPPNPFTDRYPYLTCESGAGNQANFPRRPLISAEDVNALVICELGSGMNGLGHYMYHGGINPVGLTHMQESRASGYPNDCPVISYDFKSPLGDCGQYRKSYRTLASLHSFIKSFGEYLAPMESTLPLELPSSPLDTDCARLALRTDGRLGFLFVNNYVRLHDMPEYELECSITLDCETVNVEMTVPANTAFVLPIGLEIADLRFDYITAMPIAISDDTLTLSPIEGVEPVAVIDGRRIALSDRTVIGDVTVMLAGEEEYKKTVGEPLSVERCTENSISFDDMKHLGFEDRTVEYRVDIPNGARYLIVMAYGLNAAAYADKKLISDYYPDGDVWVMDVRGIEGELVMKVQPYLESDAGSVYFECAMPYGDIAPEVSCVFTDEVFV